MTAPVVNLISSGPFGPTFLTSSLPSSWAFDQTFTVDSVAGWFEVDPSGYVTTIPIGQSGPFLVEVNNEGILCSAIVGNTVFVYQSTGFNGRGYTGSIVAHSKQTGGRSVRVTATSAQGDIESSITTHAASVASVAIPANTSTIIQTTASLAIGTWAVTFSTNILGSAAGTLSLTAAVGTATGTFAGKSIADGALAVSGETEVTLTFIVTVTVAGTVTFTASTSTTGAGTTNAGASTGYTALKVA